MHRILKLILPAFLTAAFHTANAQYRTYRVVDNGIETIGYCKLSNGAVIHKYSSLPESGASVSESENGSFTIEISEFTNTEERFNVGNGVSFEQVFNSINARYCVRQGYLNFQESIKEKDKIAYQRKIKAILGYYDNAIRALEKDNREKAVDKVKRLIRYTEEIPFMRGKMEKGYLPEYVRFVENAMKSMLEFDSDIQPGYSVVVHKSQLPAKPNKKARKRRR